MIKQKISILLILFLSIIFIEKESVGQSTEYLFKAGFLEKFARFTKWPQSAEIKNTSKPFVIKVIGKSPFDGALEFMFDKQKIHNKKVNIIYIDKIEDIKNCHLLFISSSEKKTLAEIIEQAKINHVLTVSETKGFGEKGVNFNIFINKNGTLHFEINPKSLKESNLVVDMYLLEFAKIIK